MLALPPIDDGPIGWRHSAWLPRDHYMRLDSCDYSVHPSAIGQAGRGDRRSAHGAHPLRRRCWSASTSAAGPASRPSPIPTTARPPTRCASPTSSARCVAASSVELVAQRDLADYDRAFGVDDDDGQVVMPARTATTDEPVAQAAPATTGRDTAAEIAYLTRALKAPTLREAVPRLAERARAEILDPRAVPGRLPATRGRRPRIPRRRRPHPRRPLPRPQIVGGVRLRPPTIVETRHHRPPGHAGLRHR